LNLNQSGDFGLSSPVHDLAQQGRQLLIILSQQERRLEQNADVPMWNRTARDLSVEHTICEECGKP
jgi:hypothetical protein